jgi:formate dehydrogenase iron-sulfur subunit
VLGGVGVVFGDFFRARVVKRQTAGKNAGADVFGWTTAYGQPDKAGAKAAPTGGKI